MRYTDRLLDDLRREGDPVPDRLVAELARDGLIGDVNALLRRLVGNDQAIPVALPDPIETWLAETRGLPAWADRDRLDRGSAFFVEHGLLITLILGTSSLVECYAAQMGCKVLAFSYRLGHTPYRRIAETTQWVLWIIGPEAFHDTGQAIPAIQKVRLMHAAIRHLIRQTGRWPEDELGVPICQEDLVGTLLAFSQVVLRDLARLGVEVDEAEADDFAYFWRVVGEMLGIRPDIIPRGTAEALDLGERIARRHQGPSPEGIALTRALLEFHADLIPGKRFDGVVPALVRELVGDRLADWMEVPRTRWQGMVRRTAAIGAVLDDDPDERAGEGLVDRLALALLTRQAIALNGYERTGFELPTALRQTWAERGRL